MQQGRKEGVGRMVAYKTGIRLDSPKNTMARVAVEWADAAQVHDACTSMILDHKGDV